MREALDGDDLEARSGDGHHRAAGNGETRTEQQTPTHRGRETLAHQGRDSGTRTRAGTKAPPVIEHARQNGPATTRGPTGCG